MNEKYGDERFRYTVKDALNGNWPKIEDYSKAYSKPWRIIEMWRDGTIRFTRSDKRDPVSTAWVRVKYNTASRTAWWVQS